MALFNKKNLEKSKVNKYGITEDDMIGELNGFPVGVVVRMMEECELQGNKPNIIVLQDSPDSAFDWFETEAGWYFWECVIEDCDFDRFFKKYPEYEKYN